MKPQITAPSAGSLTPDEQRLVKQWKSESARFGKAREAKREDTPQEIIDAQNRYARES